MPNTPVPKQSLPRRGCHLFALVFAFAFLLPTTVTSSASAQLFRGDGAVGETGNVCVRDFRAGATCNANDVRIEELIVLNVIEDCESGTIGEAEVVFDVLVSADGSPDRYDIGIFLALDGGSARDGDQCHHNYLAPPLTTTPTYGDSNGNLVDDIDGGPWLDNDSDQCGDLATNTEVIKELPSLRFACIDNNGDGSADISACSSWDNNDNTTCSVVADAFPGTNSKCGCETIELGFSPAPEITIEKMPENQIVSTGGTAAFNFEVTSTTFITGVTVTDPDCDAAPSFTGGDTSMDGVLNPDEVWTYTCSKSNVTMSFTNTVTVNGSSPLGPVMDTDTSDVTVTENPVIGVAKRVVSLEPAFVRSDPVIDVEFEILVENLGDVPLDMIQVTDNLNDTFPAPVFFNVIAGPVASSTLTANPGYNGDTDQNLLIAASSTLAVGATATISFTVQFHQNGSATTEFFNQAFASGQSPNDAPTMDPSDNGSDPDPDGNGNPNEEGNNDPTPFGVVEAPSIGLAKRVIQITDVSVGVFDVELGFTVENFGNVDLDTVQVTDDLTATFPGPSTFVIQSGPTASGTLTENGSFNGDGDQNLLVAGSSTLPTGASETISVTVRLTTNGELGPFSNEADASGTSPQDAVVMDDSVDGLDPDPNGDDDPDEMSPTPIVLSEDPVIGVAKQASAATDVGGGQFEVMLTFTVENLGDVALDTVQVTDDLTATFPAPATFSIQIAPSAGGTLTENPGFNGDTDTNLLVAASSNLPIGATESITVTVRFDPNGLSGPFNNVAVARGLSPQDTETTDTSDDGTDPDPNGNGNPDEKGENDPTPIRIPEDPRIGVAKRVVTTTDLGNGSFDVELEFNVENLGNVDLDDVQVTDNLDATFTGAAIYSIQTSPSATGTLTANGGFNGSGDINLLNAASSTLAVGVTEQISVTIRFDPNGETGPFLNQAFAEGFSPLGVQTTDTSDDGLDPDPSGNDDPEDPGENDPTPIVVPENPVIGVAKRVISLTDNGDGEFDVVIGLVLENLGNVDLINVQATDDLDATFPPPSTFSVIDGPTATGTLQANGSFDGMGVTELLNAANSSLAIGATATIEFTVRFYPMGETGPFFNTVDAVGEAPSGDMTSDTSDDGTDPDPNANNNPSEPMEDDPTPIVVDGQDVIEIPTQSTVGLLLLMLLLATVGLYRLR